MLMMLFIGYMMELVLLNFFCLIFVVWSIFDVVVVFIVMVVVMFVVMVLLMIFGEFVFKNFVLVLLFVMVKFVVLF